MNNREAFEAWAEAHCYYLDKDSEGKYVKNTTGMAWQIWRAAKKTPPLDFSKSQIGNYAAEEIIRTMWANGMESEAQSLADCFYGLVDANAAIASQTAELSRNPLQLPAQKQQDHIPDGGNMVQSQAQQPTLVEISEYGEGQENDCPECGAESGESCSSSDGVEYGRKVHESRQSQAQQEIQWISVEERLPEDNSTVMAADQCGNIQITFYTENHDYFNHTYGYKLNRKDHGKYSKRFEWARKYPTKITHWMPLPPAPEGGNNE